jgi:hypothetical protein
MSGKHGLPTASVVRSSQATPARRRGQPCAAFNPAEIHLSSPDSCSKGWGHLYLHSGRASTIPCNPDASKRLMTPPQPLQATRSRRAKAA